MRADFVGIEQAVALTRPLHHAFANKKNSPASIIERLSRRADASAVTRDELVDIALVKLAGVQSPGDVRQSIELNAQDAVLHASRAALSANSAKSAVQPLSDLSGVGVAVASAVLAWCKPEQWPVIDKHAWSTLYAYGLVPARRHPTSFSDDEYATYCDVMIPLASKVGLSLQQLDRWAYSFSKCGLRPESLND